MASCEIRRENIPKVLSLYKELKDHDRYLEIEPDINKTRQPLEDKTSISDNEEVDVTSICDDEKLDCESNVSVESISSQKLRRSSSSSSLTVHVCTYEGCDKFFSRPYRLAQHMRTHTGERPYVCPVEDCSRSYTRQQHLKRHLEVVHQDKEMEEDIKCVMCEKTFSNIYCLRKHVHRFHEKKRYDCSECGQSFLKQQHLLKHTYTHSGVKPYLCEYPGCEKRFLTQSKRRLHMVTHQKKRYACPEESCPETFDVYSDLQRHIPAVHPKVCDICSKPFKQLRFLRKHRLTHEPEVEAYFCSYPACDRYYFHLSNLMSHIKDKHQQLKIYRCGVCDKRLSTKQKLIQHMTTHEPAYKRNYMSKKSRKPRKDKGIIRKNLPSLLSGYTDDVKEGDMTQTVQPETTPEKNNDASANADATQNSQSEESSRDVLESDKTL